MEISPGIEIVDTALWLREKSALIVNDLHFGYEEMLHRRGILVPKFQSGEIFAKMEAIIKKTSPETVIINGDLKHEFGGISSQEWKDVLRFFDFLLHNSKGIKKVIVIKGNHDCIIGPITEKRNVKVVAKYTLGDTIVVHGDSLVKTNASRIIIGHEHPAITLREKGKYEKYKCFLQGRWKGKELIAVPSFNPLLEGTDILKEQMLSPFLKNIPNIPAFKIYIVNEGEVFFFGKFSDIDKLVNKVRESASPRSKERGLNKGAFFSPHFETPEKQVSKEHS